MSSCSLCCLWRNSPSSSKAAAASSLEAGTELTAPPVPQMMLKPPVTEPAANKVKDNNNTTAGVSADPVDDESTDCDERSTEQVAEGAPEHGDDTDVHEEEQQPLPAPEAPLLQLSRFAQQMLEAHNAYRAHHNAGALAPCPVLAKRAQYWADTLAASNRMWHESQSWDGENIAMKYSSARQNFAGSDFVNMWYYEGLHYGFPGTQLGTKNNGKQLVTGHFTQVVWKHSRRVGFGRAVSKTGRVYVVARYRPPGNFQRYYNANVLPPIDGKLRVRYQPAAN